MKTSLLVLSVFIFASPSFGEASDAAPAALSSGRSPEQGCAWKQVTSSTKEISVRVQECPTDTEHLRYIFDGNNLVEKSAPGSSSEPPYALIRLFEKPAASSPAAALAPFIAKLSPYEQKHCVVRNADPKRDMETPFHDSTKSAWKIAPDAEYQKKIEAESKDSGIPDPVCGEYGLSFDSRSYFEFHQANTSRFAWVDVGQDTPLFDEQSLSF